VRRQPADRVFTPERLTDEHRLVARTVAAFEAAEVRPVRGHLEGKDWALARRLLRRCGDLGLLGVDVADADGGVHVDTVTSMLVSERLGESPSFGATFGAQVNLAVLPVSLFGTASQKQRYLPGLLSGELVGAYCLTEPGSGSDARSIRTHASRQADGSFVLNGEKAWITNGGIADLFVVFAKVDGEHFTAFLVERRFGGVTSGPEEHKMGLDGSSTTSVLLQDVRVPAGNLLGQIGKGHRVAFSVLNFARVKLGATCCGGAVGAIGESARYAAARRQFGQPIASFGAIRHKIGEMVVRAYAAESLTYRIGGLIDERIARDRQGAFDPAGAVSAFEEFAVEASIAKVAGSEMLDFVLDENIQVHGGNGYGRDYPAERHYRDARVNRIFEGTNEINRLLIPAMLVKRAAAWHVPLASAARAAGEPLQGRSANASPQAGAAGFLSSEAAIVDRAKAAALVVIELAIETFRERLADEQEIAMGVADMLIDVLSADSAVLRAQAATAADEPDTALHAAAAGVFVNDAAARVTIAGHQALAAIAGIPRATARTVPPLALEPTPINTVVLRRRLADEAVRRGAYPFASRADRAAGV
jgi:alkylation response protein AidB-like acyl-CoA dehydrogenase